MTEAVLAHSSMFPGTPKNPNKKGQSFQPRIHMPSGWKRDALFEWRMALVNRE